MAQRSNYPVTIKVIPPLGREGLLAGQFREVRASRARVSPERCAKSGGWRWQRGAFHRRFRFAFLDEFQKREETKKKENKPTPKLKTQQTRKFPRNLDRFRSIQTCYFLQIVTTLLCWAIGVFVYLMPCFVRGFLPFFNFFFFLEQHANSVIFLSIGCKVGGEGECLTAQQALWGYSLSYWDELNNSPLIYTPAKLACWQVHN